MNIGLISAGIGLFVLSIHALITNIRLSKLEENQYK